MISALIGLQTAIAMRHNSFMGYSSAMNYAMNPYADKSAAMQRVQYSTMMKIADAQQNYYQKLLNDNIKRSFNIFA